MALRYSKIPENKNMIFPSIQVYTCNYVSPPVFVEGGRRCFSVMPWGVTELGRIVDVAWAEASENHELFEYSRGRCSSIKERRSDGEN